ncbi:hypothetical protein DJ564_30140 [Pseudomonas sp. 31-12]|nr:hypothetical protein DJ564_30140 [Pseudomonas sp. 31-12]
MWRGGLPPLGCEAAPKSTNAVCQDKRIGRFTTASQPNGGKPPRHSRCQAFIGTHMNPCKTPRSLGAPPC